MTTGATLDERQPDLALEVEAAAQERNGPGNLRDLLHSGAIWNVD